MIRVKYDTTKYNFRKTVETYLETRDLEQIHELSKFEGILTDSMGGNSDQGQYLHRKFYDNMDVDPLFKEMYDSFIEEVIRPELKSSIIYQKFPTFRIHQPDNICVFEWHRDKDFNHSPKEINIFMPITKAFDTNTFWAESEEGKNDHKPMEGDYGEVVLWNGANLSHGNKTNETGLSRLSFDFRVMYFDDYNERLANASLTKNTKFTIGAYFDEKVVE